MSTVAVHVSDPTLAKVRGMLALDGITGQAGEVTVTLANQPGGVRLFQSCMVMVEGPYSVSVSTEETFFLSLRPDGDVQVQVGPNTGTTARFSVTRVDAFEYQLSAKETRYIFVERRISGDTKLHVIIRWS